MLAGQAPRTQPFADLVDAELAALDELAEQPLVAIGRRLDELGAIVARLRRERGRDLALDDAHPERLVVPTNGFHRDEIDDAFELVLGADRQLQRDRLRLQALADLLEHSEEVRAGPIHLVDEGNARHAVIVRLAPDGLGLRLDAADRRRTPRRRRRARAASAALRS